MNDDRKLIEGRLHQEFHDKKKAAEKEIIFLSELTIEQAAEIENLRDTIKKLGGAIERLTNE